MPLPNRRDARRRRKRRGRRGPAVTRAQRCVTSPAFLRSRFDRDGAVVAALVKPSRNLTQVAPRGLSRRARSACFIPQWMFPLLMKTLGISPDFLRLAAVNLACHAAIGKLVRWRHCEFEQALDKNGVIYYLGTNALTAPWHSQAVLHEIRIGGSACRSAKVVSREPVAGATFLTGQHTIVDLRPRSFLPSRYTLHISGALPTLDVVLEASSDDGRTWDSLDWTPHDWTCWTPTTTSIRLTAEFAYSMFRLVAKQRTFISCFDLHGTLFESTVGGRHP
ncbi:F5/8 type C domain-containing protein [Plasmodiophora brassicae]|uniref:Uncharacterized protein n=1 Tax=Plasmodiophora brassicae TaxID=37360 RepID=A0A0G4II53_PLABS|nr:hypothetical protein PBRA_003568 [Plasmodiophora brassicae]